MTHGQKTALAIGLTAIAMLFVLAALSPAHAASKPPVVKGSCYLKNGVWHGSCSVPAPPKPKPKGSK